jgi:adenylate kinase
MLSRLVFLGPPGAGKSTQSAIASEKLGIPDIATGAIFREAIARGNALGKEISQFVNSGLLVPDKLTNAIVVERLKKEDCAKGYILDGYPRSLDQAQALDLFLKKKGEPLEKVLYIKVEPDIVAKRMAQRRICSKCSTPYNLMSQPPKKEGLCDRCGGELIPRADDKPESIRKRLQTYQQITTPLRDYYAKQNVLTILDASQTVEVIAKEIASIIGAAV